MEAARRHMNTLFLEVRVSNEEAQRLYKNHGFEVLGLRKEFMTFLKRMDTLCPEK